MPGTFTWQEARAAALSRTHLGVPGHLVTITSASENEFINSAFNVGIDGYGAWIGGYEPADDGIWRWADGPEAGIQFSFWAAATPPFNYANWGGVEPSNTRPPDENYAWINIGAPFPGVGRPPRQFANWRGAEQTGQVPCYDRPFAPLDTALVFAARKPPPHKHFQSSRSVQMRPFLP